MKTSLRIAILSAAVFALACGDDDKTDSDGAAEESLTGDCAKITAACHEYDVGTGPAHDCHELAHENDTATCTDQLSACQTACAAE